MFLIRYEKELAEILSALSMQKKNVQLSLKASEKGLLQGKEALKAKKTKSDPCEISL